MNETNQMLKQVKRHVPFRSILAIAVGLAPVVFVAVEGKPVRSTLAYAGRQRADDNAQKTAEHVALMRRLNSTNHSEFYSALSALAALDEPGALDVWQVALQNPDLNLQKEAWSRYGELRSQLTRKESVPRVARISSPFDQVEALVRAAGLEITRWADSQTETIAALPQYALDLLSRAGLDVTVLYDTIAEWQQARSRGDQLASRITPEYQSADKRHEVRIAVVDLDQRTEPYPGYSDWLGDGENFLMRNGSLIAYLDVFPSDGSAQSIASHLEESYRRRGYKVVSFQTPSEFSDNVQQFFPGKSFEAGRRVVKGDAALRPALANGRFHSYQETLSEFTALADSHQDIARVVNLGPTYEGRQIFALKITRDPAANDATKPDVLITGCHHAREWISVEPPVYFANQLVNGYSTDDAIKYLVDRLQIWIVPVMNPDGLTYSQGSANDQLDLIRLWRKNRRPVSTDACISGTGIDLNRNYGYQWRLPGDNPCPYYADDSGGSDNPDSELYRGPAPNSELELKAINALTGDPSRRFRARLDYHNFSELILYPWGYQAGLSPDDGILAGLATRMSNLVLATGKRFYRPERSIQLYLATGISTDYAYAVDRVPAPFTIELRPACCEFNVPESDITIINEENWAAARSLLSWAAGPPILQSVNAYQAGSDGGLTKLVYSARWIETEGIRQIGVETRLPRIEPGRLQVRLEFSKPMDIESTPAVMLGHSEPVNELRFQPAEGSGGWKKTLYRGDTWVGEATIPPWSGQNSEWKLSVQASDKTPFELDAKPDTVATYVVGMNGWQYYEDSGGAGFTGGADQEHVLPPTAQPGELIVLVGAPKGGERLAGGDTYQVAWTTPRDGGLPAQQEVWLTTDGGSSFTPVVAGIPGTADKYLVVLPRASTTRARIRVFARGGGLGSTIFGDSEADFTIGANVGSAIEFSLLSSELVDQVWTDQSTIGPDGPLTGSSRLLIDVKVTNRGSVPIANPFLRIADITRNNVLLSRDVNSLAGASARQSIDAGNDNVLSPGEGANVRLVVGLLRKKKFALSADAYGVAVGGAVNSAEPVYIWRGKPRNQ